ncbi:MAG: hypothetical protein K1X64_22255 [Myxococcaceae bacterium]|nr:hypothetical protein [Myxococcaceae bacterium]
MTAVTLFLVLSLSDSTDAARSQLLKTLSASLDPARVALKPRVLGTAPRDVLDILAQRQPLIEVRWATTTQATVRAALTPGKWTTRVLTFSAADRLNERAKTIAFTIAAMTPDWQPPQPAPEPEVAPEVTALSESDLQPAPPLPDTAAPETKATAARVDIQASAAPEAENAPFHGFLALSAVGTLSHSTGGAGLEFGACPFSVLCAGISGAVFTGAFPDIDTSRLDARVEGLIDFRWTPLWSSRLGLNARLSAGALLISLHRGQDSVSRWAAVGGLEAGPLLRLGSFEMALAFGARLTGETKVFINELQVAEIEKLFATGRLSLGWRF